MRFPLFWQPVISLLPILNILYSQNIFTYAAPLNQTDMVYDFEDVGIPSLLNLRNLTDYF